jgi:hypothetical protein
VSPYVSSLFAVHNENMADGVENSSDVTCLPGYVPPESYVRNTGDPYERLITDPRVSQEGL